jgi:hypothetical protein
MTDNTMQLDVRLPLSINYTFHPKSGGSPAYVDIHNVSIGILSNQTSIYDILPFETLNDLEERVLAIHIQENPNV